MSQTSIRWEEVHRRLRKTEESLAESLSENPARMKAIFRQRAARLASERAEDKAAVRGTPTLVFSLGRERYAVPLKVLAEVVPFQNCVPIPGAPPYFQGVINLRGELRPVIDLARIISGTSSADSGAVLILRRPAALKVDSVDELREIGAGEIAPSVHGQFVQAVASGTLALLDVEAILSTVLSPKENRSR
jgi:purine-binding chemotaxis protein CheW